MSDCKATSHRIDGVFGVFVSVVGNVRVVGMVAVRRRERMRGCGAADEIGSAAEISGAAVVVVIVDGKVR